MGNQWGRKPICGRATSEGAPWEDKAQYDWRRGKLKDLFFFLPRWEAQWCSLGPFPHTATPPPPSSPSFPLPLSPFPSPLAHKPLHGLCSWWGRSVNLQRGWKLCSEVKGNVCVRVSQERSRRPPCPLSLASSPRISGPRGSPFILPGEGVYWSSWSCCHWLRTDWRMASRNHPCELQGLEKGNWCSGWINTRQGTLHTYTAFL